MSNLSCHETKRKVYEYLGDELDAKVKQEVDGHLASCQLCKAEYDLERTISNLVINSSSGSDRNSDFFNKISSSLRSELD
ncbi:MAG: zf-HC2 domain-containing protein [Rhodoluna sp.]|nr:zf-HC2 domain-containing protein [Rhodoluna sp.]